MFEYYWRTFLPDPTNLYFLWAMLAFFMFIYIRVILNLIRKDPRLVNFAKQFPGPTVWPYIGNGLDFLDNMDGSMEMLKMYEEKYGQLYRLWFGKRLVIGVANLDILEEIFMNSKTLNKPEFMDPAREYWGDNLFTSRPPLWRKSRKELQPIFARNVLVEKVPLINNIIQKYVKQIEDRANGHKFDIGQIFPMLVFDVLLKVVFNTSLEYDQKDLALLDKLMHEADSIFFEKMFHPWLQNPVADFLMYGRFKHRFKRQTTKFFKKIMRNQDQGTSNTENPESERKATFIELLHKIRDDLQLDDKYVRDETLNTVAAGTMTTSTTLSFCILMVAMHPYVQNRLYEELKDHFGSEDREADINDLDSLPYLDQVLKETERRFPLVPTILRNVDEDTEIGSYVFPAGTAILIPVSTIHANPNYYEHPEAFDPEHFSPVDDGTNRRPKLAFLPFSAGPRNCIGKVLAELELKLTLIAFLRRFEFHTLMTMDDINLLPGISITNRKGYWVTARIR